MLRQGAYIVCIGVFVESPSVRSVFVLLSFVLIFR